MHRFMSSNCILSLCNDGVTLWVHSTILPKRPNPSMTTTRTLWAFSSVQTISQPPMFLPFYCTKTCFQRIDTLLQFFVFGIMLSHRFHVSCPVTTLLWLRTLPSSWHQIAKHDCWQTSSYGMRQQQCLKENTCWQRTAFQNSLNLHWQIKQRFWLGTLPSHKVHAGFRLSTRRVTRDSMSWN